MNRARRPSNQGATQGTAPLLLGLLCGAVLASAALGNDPTGDQLLPGTSPDLTALSARWQADLLLIDLNFDGPVVPADASTPGDGGLFGFVDLDTDRDTNTGARSAVDFLTAARPDLTTHLGIDLQVDLASWSNGTVDLRDQQSGLVLARVAAAETANGLRLSIPSALVGSASQAVNVAAVVGNQNAATDTAPNGGYVTTSAASGTELGNGRFVVAVQWEDFSGNQGVGTLVTKSSDSALYWFFDSANWELLVKVLDGCGVNDRYWVFLAATTNVGFQVEVTDTSTGTVRIYDNPLGTSSASVNDIEAFSSCAR